MAASGNLTLEQIGERAGVSRSTVSRVLNDHPEVRPEVRARVRAVIEETGYSPNPAARALVSNRSGLIGLVMLTDVDELFGDPYYSALVNGIQRGCLEHDLIFSIFPVVSADGGAEVLTGQIANGLVDGVIVTAGPRSEQVIASLRTRATKVVVIGHPVDDRDIVRIDVDNRSGGALAANHLIDLGYERIGFIGPGGEYVFGVERLDGFRDAMQRDGRSVDERLVRLGEPSEAAGYRAALSMLADRPDAIFVATDTMAMGVMRAIRERGRRVPDDVAVVGFDGLPTSPPSDPPLTTIVQPAADVGAAAVAMLAGAPDPPRLTLLPVSLRVGASCGAAPLGGG